MVRLRLLVGLVVLCASLAACGRSGDSLLAKDTLTVGVRPDLPGLGHRKADGTFEGFDIDVARYVGERLGKKVRFVPVLANDRIPALTSGRADLVLATLSVTPERKTQIAFAGPYFLSYQDVLVRTGERGVKGVRDLKGRRFCGVEGADPVKRLQALNGMDKVTIVEARDYDECMTKIGNGAVDAITTNDVILAGLAKRAGGQRYRLVNAQISEQSTGIGIRQGDLDGCEALNKAVTRMYQDGTATRLVGKWFAGTGLGRATVQVPQFEGCM
ncbi:transporter substrate-binding domain-containing protein [Actinomadura hibisca]|uniref:transporter substrate-binding domain-containing protein n=1 Tax=Actinomadura hibisca TaxID=68565 RepID=UPI000A405AF5|nr:transporter substrate-binding domain-containing protein [Actinomadura hibisca]